MVVVMVVVIVVGGVVMVVVGVVVMGIVVVMVVVMMVVVMVVVSCSAQLRIIHGSATLGLKDLCMSGYFLVLHGSIPCSGDLIYNLMVDWLQIS